jgi:hypothetical protein
MLLAGRDRPATRDSYILDCRRIFTSWQRTTRARLVSHRIAVTPFRSAQLGDQRELAVTLINAVWELLELDDRTVDEDERMLHNSVGTSHARCQQRTSASVSSTLRSVAPPSGINDHQRPPSMANRTRTMPSE